MEVNIPAMLKNLALTLVPADKRQALEQAISKAQEALSSAGDNPQQALVDNNVPPDFLKELKSKINTPWANRILSGLNISTQDAEKTLDDLISGKEQIPVAQLPPPSQPRVNFGQVVTQEQRNEMMNKLRRGLKNI